MTFIQYLELREKVKAEFGAAHAATNEAIRAKAPRAEVDRLAAVEAEAWNKMDEVFAIARRGDDEDAE